MQQLGNIKYYLLCMLAALGLYTFAGTMGYDMYGDDDVHDASQAQGLRHSSGGHGFYYHK